MKKIVALLLMLILVACGGGGGGGEGSPTTQNPNPEPIVVDRNPLVLASIFSGNTKTEFETTTEFNARINAKLVQYKNTSILLDEKMVYNADTSIGSVNIDGFGFVSDKNISGHSYETYWGSFTYNDTRSISIDKAIFTNINNTTSFVFSTNTSGNCYFSKDNQYSISETLKCNISFNATRDKAVNYNIGLLLGLEIYTLDSFKSSYTLGSYPSPLEFTNIDLYPVKLKSMTIIDKNTDTILGEILIR